MAEVLPISVVVALDLSGSMVNDLKLAKDAAETFMLRLLPADRARIVGFDDLVRFSPEFTSDRDKLIDYLRNGMQFGNGTRLWDALYESAGVRCEVRPVRVGVTPVAAAWELAALLIMRRPWLPGGLTTWWCSTATLQVPDG